MRVRRLIATTSLLAALSASMAHAGPKQDIQAKVKEAMENYDLMDYDAARKLLTQALAIAKKSKLDKDPLVAKAHLYAGIVAFVNQDTDGAKLAFLSAVAIDPKIQIDAAYKSPEMAKLLDEARTEAGGGGDGAVEPAGGPDCSTVKGLEHTIIDSATAGKAQRIEALVAEDVVAKKIAVMYRPEGATEFIEVALQKDGACKYSGSIPAAGMKGSLVHYYVAAFNDVGKPVASKGSSGSPNIIELAAAAGGGATGGGDTEDPIGTGGTTSGGDVSTGVVVGPRKARAFLAVTGGAGSGFVTGETEGMNTVKNTGLSNPIVAITPELGFFVSPQLSFGIAARIGLPLGANVEGHATAAPAGLVRVRYSPAATGEGLRVMGQAGVGVLRNTIKLDNSMPNMDTDVVAQGPILLGGGIGFTKRLNGSVSFVADFSVLAGIAAFEMTGISPKFNSGVSADVVLGLQLGL